MPGLRGGRDDDENEGAHTPFHLSFLSSGGWEREVSPGRVGVVLRVRVGVLCVGWGVVCVWVVRVRVVGVGCGGGGGAKLGHHMGDQRCVQRVWI